MTLISCHAKIGFANSYVLGPDGGGVAALIDPGFFDSGLFERIELAGLVIGAVLLTGHHPAHVGGLATVLRVYRAQVYGGGQREPGRDDPAPPPSTQDETVATTVRDGQSLRVGSLAFHVHALPGHASDAVAYRLGDILFPGAALHAGGIGGTPSAAARTALVDAIRTRILTLPDRVTIMPAHGPPTTVKAERAFNPALLPSPQITG